MRGLNGFKGGSKRRPIILSIGTRKPDDRAMPVHSNECYWVGYGYLGGLRLLKRRIFLRIRSAEGICRYLLWTTPERGKEFMFVKNFVKKIEITREQAEKHFGTKL